MVKYKSKQRKPQKESDLMPGEIEDMKLETPRKIDRAFAKEFGFHWWEDSYEND